MKKLWISILVVFLLSGCAAAIGKTGFDENLDKLEQMLNREEWNDAKENFNNLQEHYGQQKWKIQLLGDEGEYESLLESIKRLEAAIAENNGTEAKMELVTIRALVEAIYSL